MSRSQGAALVSIVIPCFNCEGFIAETLLSVAAQSYPHIEIILVDDGSSDASMTRAKEVPMKFPVSIKVQVNQGQAAARQNGAAQAKGKYLLFLDSDDKISPEYVSSCVSVLESDEGVSIVYSKASFFGAKAGPWVLPDFSVEDFLLENCIFISAVIRKSDFDRVGGFDVGLRFYEDWDLFISIIKAGGKVFRIDKDLFCYRKREAKGSLTDSAKREVLSDSILRIYNKHYSFYKKNGIFAQDLFSFRRYKRKYYGVWYRSVLYSLLGKKKA